MLRMTALCRARITRTMVAPVAAGRLQDRSFPGDTFIPIDSMGGELTWDRTRPHPPATTFFPEEHPLTPRRLPFALGAFASTPVWLQRVQKTVPTPPPSKAFDVTDLATYPPYSDANIALLVDAINARRADNSALPKVTKGTSRVRSFLPCWEDEDSEGMVATHSLMINSLIPESNEEKVMRLLDDALNNRSDQADMKLVEREEFVTDMKQFIEQAAVRPNLQKTTIFRLCSTRGSGKTQLLKNCLHAAARDEILGGSVLIVDCGLPRSPFLSAFKKLKAKSLVVESDIVEFVTSLIRAHMKKRCGVTLKRHATILDAYTEWAKHTNCRTTHNLMLVFDTIEELPQKTGIARSNSKGTRGFIEALAFLLPSQSGILAVGTKVVETLDIKNPTNIVVRESEVPRLPALTFSGYIAALHKSWGRLREEDLKGANITTAVLHYLCGGAPRLLRLASSSGAPIDRLLLVESWGEMITCSTKAAMEYMQSEYPWDGTHYALMWALGALASGTKTRVDLEAAVPLMGGTTWGAATKGLLYLAEDQTRACSSATPSCRGASGASVGPNMGSVVRLPPALMFDTKVLAFFDQLRKGTFTNTPSALASWPKGLDVALLHVARMPTDTQSTYTQLTFGNIGPIKRGGPYEQLVANALVARWYLLWLLGGRKSKQIDLGTILGTTKNVAGLTVDFSGGLLENRDQSYPLLEVANTSLLQCCWGGGGHHDIRFAARKGDGTRIVVCCQLRSGDPKSADLSKQVTLKGTRRTVGLLLSISPEEKDVTHTSKYSLLNDKCVHVRSDCFSYHESLFPYDPVVAKKTEKNNNGK